MKKCPYCEAEVSETAKKCKHCGERINDEIKIATINKINGKYEKRKKTGNNKIIELFNRHTGFSLFLCLFLISIIIGFMLPKEYGLGFFGIFIIIWIIVSCVSIFEGEISMILPFGFGLSIISLILFIGMIFFSSVTARSLYNIGIIGPLTYSNIICNKTAGFLKKCTIKGNVSYDTGEKIYHVIGCSKYGLTVINKEYGESMFPNKNVAEKAGFRKCNDEKNVVYSDEYDPGYDYIDDYDSFMPRGY